MREETRKTVNTLSGAAVAVVAIASLVGGVVWYGAAQADEIWDNVNRLSQDFQKHERKLETIEKSNAEIKTLLQKLIAKAETEDSKAK